VLAFAILAAAPQWLGPCGIGLLIGISGSVTRASAEALVSGRRLALRLHT
jgi:hypothetical protein